MGLSANEDATAAPSATGVGLGSPVLDQLAVSVLNEKWLSVLRKGLAAYAIGSFVYRTGMVVRHRFVSRSRFALVIDEEDTAFDEVIEWLVKNQPTKRHRVLLAQTSKVREGVEGANGKGPQRREAVIKLMFEGESAMHTFIEGHRVTFSIAKPEVGVMQKDSRMRQRDKLRIVTRSEEGRNAVVRLLAKFTADRNADRQQPDVFVLNGWGDWTRRSDVPPRKLDTVVLAAGQVEKVVLDLEAFLSTEQAYVRLGQPWHRGYLLHGPPGTGKTSLAKALANHFDMDIYCIPLGDVKDDSSISNLISSVPSRSILLLEDIDVFHASTSSEERESGKGLTLSGLLNSLDGLSTPHGLITILTTNHPEKLKDELVRRGRVDMRVCIDYVAYEQIIRMFNIFYGGHIFTKITEASFDALGRLVPAQITEAIKCNLGDPVGAENEILELRGVHAKSGTLLS